MSKLVIVESPAKAKTIKKYLGEDYNVIASMGHIRDLPKAQIGVDIEDNFKPRYINIPGKSNLSRSSKPLLPKAKPFISQPTRTVRARQSAGIWHIFSSWIPHRKTA